MPSKAEPSSDDPVAASTWQYIRDPGIADQYDAYFRYNALFRYDVQLLDELLTEPGAVADFGCGTGRHLTHLAARGFRVCGIDLSTRMLDISKRKLRAEALDGGLVQAAIDRAPLRRGAFDYAICMFSTLGMVRGRGNRLRVLTEMHRVLKPGGLCVVHAHSRWFNVWYADGRQWLRRNIIDGWRGRCEPGDKIIEGYRGIPNLFLHVYTAGEFERQVREAGFSIERMVYLNVARNGEQRGWLRAVRANGFICAARRESG